MFVPAIREAFRKLSCLNLWVSTTKVSNSTIFTGVRKISGFTVEGNQLARRTRPNLQVLLDRVLRLTSGQRIS